MADVLKQLVVKVMFNYIPVDDSSLFVQELQWKGQWHLNFNRLTHHLRMIMRGYENEETRRLLKEMKVMLQEITGRDLHMNHLKIIMLGYENEEAQEMIRFEIGDGRKDEILKIIEELCVIRFGSSVEGEEIFVGFDDEVKTLLDQLTQTSIKQLQVISIAGMAGLGKTTLARKLYRDPLIEYYFDIRAWTCVSQVYQKRDLLLGILSSFVDDLTEISQLGDEKLEEKLYRLLKGRRYLVVLDDIWDCMAWNDLKMYFPDDKVGSRVLFTGRDTDMSLHVGAARHIPFLFGTYFRTRYLESAYPLLIWRQLEER